jgi:holliday junction DNA helicase ruvA
MYAYIKGSLEVKTSGYIVIDVNGIGYKIFMSETAIAELGEIGQIVKVHTYLKVKEDEMSLYGFNTNEELRMFELLLSVSGIGAKSAINILSNITPSSFALAVITNDVAKIKALPGIGPKGAQRIILELKDKLNKQQDIEEVEKQVQKVVDTQKYNEAISALQVLGYSKKEIECALKGIGEDLTVEEIIKLGLKNLAR